ncbi:hypothetical protein JRQ81_010041 [Phrynocephalus forsythii]|uniref:non-specific serine/threonine protein kinase n=1 Tax=Phrynocephalus forsythii TaxID=171643 RepID=A0A9Q1B706_9SAUR|nr:hypothetical protein JRQ81_010041 [Phrynocephalus forsythii]
MAANYAGPHVCMAKLNEHCQRRSLKLEYRDIATTGPAHDRVFTVAVVINGRQYSTGTGKSKKEAKGRAAGTAWEIIEQEMQQMLASRPQEPPLPAAPMQAQPAVPTLPQPLQLPAAAGNQLEALPTSSVNWISKLNEYASKHQVIVDYQLESQSGPPHMPIFSYFCEIGGKVFGHGEGNNKQTAKLFAAKEAYENLIGLSSSRMERSGACTDTSTNSSFSESHEVLKETSVKSVEEAMGAASNESDSIVFLDSNATADKLADQVNGLHLNGSSSSSPEILKGPAVKPKRKETPLAPKFSKLVQKESEYTVNKRFLEDFCDIQKLGSGGYGDVLKAKNIIDENIYAIKRVKIRLFSTSASISEKTEKVQKEVMALSQFHHENIVRYFSCWMGQDIFSSEDSVSHNSCGEAKRYSCLFIRMEYCEKGTLTQWISDERRKASNNDVLMKFRQIVNGVKYIHSNNFIHRDLKPLNIFISKDDKMKIGDFGLVTTGVDDLSAERTRGAGTMGYLAPEQVLSHYGKEVDIFALGLILFEMLYTYETSHEKAKVWSKVREGIFPDKFSSEFPREVKLIKKLIAEKASERPAADYILKVLDKQAYSAHTY